MASPSCYNLGVTSQDSTAHRELVASPEDTGTRLDRFVADHCPKLSRTRVQELIEAGDVHIDGKAAKKGAAKPAERMAAYFLALTLRNVRCFGDEPQTLNLSDKEGRPARWTVLRSVCANGSSNSVILSIVVSS